MCLDSSIKPGHNYNHDCTKEKKKRKKKTATVIKINRLKKNNKCLLRKGNYSIALQLHKFDKPQS